jgi:hypothetical protein
VLASEVRLKEGQGITYKLLGKFYEAIQQERAAFEAFVQPAAPVVVGKRDKADVVLQEFPAKAAPAKIRTAWEVHWDFVPSINGGAQLLRIVSAQFKFKDKNANWKSVMVARDIYLAEAFSAYDDGVTCFMDLFHRPKPGDRRADLTVQPKPQLEQCILPGETLGYSKNPKLTVLREVHDDGLRWMSGYAKAPGENRGYRGEKLVLVAGFQAVNYVYLTEYDFTDDGRIVCRLGFTAHNLVVRGQRNKIKDGDAHLHVGCWRMDFDLSDVTDPKNPRGGVRSNDYRLVSRRFDAEAKRFKQVDEAFGGGNEGKAEWIAKEFTTLRVQSDVVQNAHQRRIAYDLMPSRFGSVRGLLPTLDVANENMDFLHYDFWITHTPAASHLQPFHRVPALAAKGLPLKGNAATVWYSSPAFHAPRTEDFGGDKGMDNTRGLALTTWIEVTLRPRDLFDGTPLYP